MVDSANERIADLKRAVAEARAAAAEARAAAEEAEDEAAALRAAEGDRREGLRWLRGGGGCEWAAWGSLHEWERYTPAMHLLLTSCFSTA
jgi:hypothetical protein